MKRAKVTRRAAGMVAVGAIAAGCGVLSLGGCLQILGDDGTFVGKGGGETGGSTTTGGVGGSTAGSGGGGAGGTTSMGECAPNDTEPCYSGPAGTQDVGICKGGMRTCGADGKWGTTCEGEQLPKAEDPALLGDESCDGYAPSEPLCAAIFGDPSQQIGRAVQVGPDGSIFIAGQFQGAISFGEKTLTTHGYTDTFAAKLAPDCTPLWAAQIGGTDDEDVNNLAVDDVGDVYVALTTFGTVSLDGLTVSETAAILKLDGSTGQALWATTCGGDNQSRPLGLTVDQNGEVIVTGTFGGTLNCGDGDHVAPTGYQLFVTKLKNDDGTSVWTKTWSSSQHAEGTAVVVDSSNNVIVGGSFMGSINFGPSSYVSSGKNAFILRLTEAGDASSAQRLGTSVAQVVNGLAVGKQSVLYIAGTYQGTINLPGVGMLTNNTVPHGFVIKQQAGGGYEWGWDTMGSKSDTFNRVATDSQGQLVAVLEFDGDVTLKGTTFTNLGSTGAHDGLLVKLFEDGSVVWTRQIADAPMFSVAVGVDDTVASTGVVGASFNDTVDLGTGPLDPQGDDAFVVRHAP